MRSFVAFLLHLLSAASLLSGSDAQTAYRLAGSGIPNEGRLEVFYGGVWGTVCDDYFNDATAGIACKSLGFGNGGQILYNQYGPGVDPIWLDDVNCNGNEPSIEYCPHRPWGDDDCVHAEDISIRCYANSPAAAQSVTVSPVNGTSFFPINATTVRVNGTSVSPINATTVRVNGTSFSPINATTVRVNGTSVSPINATTVRVNGTSIFPINATTVRVNGTSVSPINATTIRVNGTSSFPINATTVRVNGTSIFPNNATTVRVNGTSSFPINATTVRVNGTSIFPINATAARAA